MSDTPADMVAYWKATDYLFKQIEHSFDPQLKPARALIRRITTRDLYSLAGESLLSPTYARRFKSIGTKNALKQIGDNLVDIVNEQSGGKAISADDIAPMFVKMGYGGKGGRNPVSELTTFFVPVKAPDSSFDVAASGGGLVSPRGGTSSEASSQCSVFNRGGETTVAENAVNSGFIVGVAPPGKYEFLCA